MSDKTCKTCRTCRWWDSHTHQQQMRFCNHDKLYLGKPEDDAAFASYNEGPILTGPDFGCIHYEAKEPA